MRKPNARRLAVLALAAALSAPLLAEERGERHERHERDLPSIVRDKTWLAECGACHVAYPPGLLPERSWRAVMDGLDRHFGENASLDPAVQKSITDFLAANAADRAGTRRSGKVMASLPAGSVPLRITELSWFGRKHDELRAEVWKRKEVGSPANCGACHPGADKGNFSEHEVAIPPARTAARPRQQG
jgi:hypothetical protein